MKATNEASEEFWDAIISSASPAADCQFCGRCHYDINGEFMEEGELEDLKSKTKSSPTNYIARDGQIHWGVIWGKQAVFGCECDHVKRLEEFVWNNRRIITNYLKSITAKRLESAKNDSEMVDNISG